MIVRVLSIWLALFGVLATSAQAQQGPLRIEITEGVIEPLPFAVPGFQPESGDAGQMAVDLARVVSEDLVGSGLCGLSVLLAMY